MRAEAAGKHIKYKSGKKNAVIQMPRSIADTVFKQKALFIHSSASLYSIQTDHPDLIEVIVSEDQSPETTCIKEVTETYARTVNHMVRIHLNPKNLGFDRKGSIFSYFPVERLSRHLTV